MNCMAGIYMLNGKYRIEMGHMLTETQIYEFDTPKEMISRLQAWYECYCVYGISPKDHYERNKQSGAEIVRYEVKNSDYERIANTSKVTKNIPQCEKFIGKQFMSAIERSSPEIQSQMQNVFSYIKIAKSSKGFAFITPLYQKDSEDSATLER